MGPTIQLEDQLNPEKEQQRMLGSFKIVHSLPDKFKDIMDKKLETLPKRQVQNLDCSLVYRFAYLFGFCN